MRCRRFQTYDKSYSQTFDDLEYQKYDAVMFGANEICYIDGFEGRSLYISGVETGNDAGVGIHSDLYSAAKALWPAITSEQASGPEQPAINGKSMQGNFFRP